MTATLRLAAAAAALTLAAAAEPASAVAPAPPPTTEGHLVTRRGAEVVDVPIAHTDVHLRVDGMLVDATVTQHFRNPYPDKIEAVYLFPLPTGAAVDDLVIRSGGRTIHGQLAERAQAKHTFEVARGRGQVAALLTQERPNLFSQDIANLEPGAEIDVTLHYVERLAYDAGGYQLVFPMVATPRAVTTKDAAAVAVTTLPPGLRSSHDISLDVELDAAVPLVALASPSHQVVVGRPSAARAHVHLAPGDTIPNKDFILRYQVAGATPQLGAIAYRDAGEGSFALVVQPPAETAAPPIAPRELIFVLDTSSSMRGAPLAKAKELVRRELGALRADDTFQIVRFADTAQALAAAPIANKPHNLAVATRWLDGLEAGGSTDIAAAFDTATVQPRDHGRLRVLVFVGDGYVGDEDAILPRVAAELGDARLACFGVGSAVNRYLLEELARLGRGPLEVVRPDGDATAALAAFARDIDAPVLTDVSIDWGGLAIADVTPTALPDVFLGAPLVVSGHYVRGGHAEITVHGTQAGHRIALPLVLDLPERDTTRPAVATLWARARIAELSRELVRRADPAVEQQILELSLASHVLTRFTAFVAVDDASTTAGGNARRVAVPVEVPEGVQAIGPATSVAYGGIVGGSVSVAVSGAGYGYGAGGGGGGWGEIGIGTIGTVGHGAGGGGSVGYGYGVGGGHGGLHGHTASVPDLVMAPPVVLGELDAAIIRRYVKRQKERLQYCYEKALLARPGLAGRLVLTFTIASSGAVASSEATFEPDATVATCAADVVRGIEFPKIEGDQLEKVTYPIDLVPPTATPRDPSSAAGSAAGSAADQGEP